MAASQTAMTWWPPEQATKAFEPEAGSAGSLAAMTTSVAPGQLGKASRKVSGWWGSPVME